MGTERVHNGHAQTRHWVGKRRSASTAAAPRTVLLSILGFLCRGWPPVKSRNNLSSSKCLTNLKVRSPYLTVWLARRWTCLPALTPETEASHKAAGGVLLTCKNRTGEIGLLPLFSLCPLSFAPKSCKSVLTKCKQSSAGSYSRRTHGTVHERPQRRDPEPAPGGNRWRKPVLPKRLACKLRRAILPDCAAARQPASCQGRVRKPGTDRATRSAD